VDGLEAMTGLQRASALTVALLVATSSGGVLASPAPAERASSAERAFQAGLLHAGDTHSCAVLHDGSASCWGNGFAGQVGNDATLTDEPSPVTVALTAGQRANAISAGVDHSCAVLDDGSASCWGSDRVGQLGNDDAAVDQPTPVAVALPAGRRAVAISAGSYHSCAVLDDGSASCWGSDSLGQLGDDDATINQPTPVAVALPAGRRAVAISAGHLHSCAVLDDGSASCWGYDFLGQLGDDDVTADQPRPVEVALPGSRRAVAISAGGTHSCAVLDDGSARCWGSDGNGRLGDGAPEASRATPVAVALPAGRRAIAISAGADHSCAILDDGSANCWGYDGRGQLGDALTLTDQPHPVAVLSPPSRRTVAISAGGTHTCAALDDGSVSCWGNDAAGQLGNGFGGATQDSAADAPRALNAASTVGRVADLSLTLEGAPRVLALGATAPITVRLRNHGPDPAGSARVSLSGRLLDLAPALVGPGSALTGSWRVGTLAAGTQTTLTLNATALAPGTAVLSAEVAGQSERDPDSIPSNDAPGEDDQAGAQIAVPSLPPAPPPADRVSADRLTLKLASRRLRRAPYRVRLSGRLIATAVSPRTGCTGSVSVSARRASRRLATVTTPLSLRDGVCEYRAVLTVARLPRRPASKVTLTARFKGNMSVLPAGSPASPLTIG
jgi:alpha-tubulin suppressor-like RCC1 family protein